MSDGAREGAQTLTRKELLVRSPRVFRVLLHNDDFTTMEFVVFVLQVYFLKDAAEATRLMLQVHLEGSCVAGRYSREVAETKVAEVTSEAERQGMPLLATAEPEDVR